jgi:signal transduction histidine kinase
VLGSAVLIYALVDRSRQSLERTNDRLDRALQQTTVLHRILRHNLRNSCNVISGNTEIVAAKVRADGGASAPATGASVSAEGESVSAQDERTAAQDERAATQDERTAAAADDASAGGSHGPDSEECLETIREQTAELVTIAEKTRQLRDFVLEERSTETVDLVAVVHERVAQARERFPSAILETELPDELMTETDPRISEALDELLENAVEHSEREQVTIQIELDRNPEGTVRLDVADDGPGMPEMERAVLSEGMESPTFHSQGLGLWIARTVVHEADGEVHIVDNEPRGTVVRLLFPE